MDRATGRYESAAQLLEDFWAEVEYVTGGGASWPSEA